MFIVTSTQLISNRKPGFECQLKFSLYRSRGTGTAITRQRHVYSIFVIRLIVKRPRVNRRSVSSRQMFSLPYTRESGPVRQANVWINRNLNLIYRKIIRQQSKKTVWIFIPSTIKSKHFSAGGGGQVCPLLNTVLGRTEKAKQMAMTSCQ